MLQGRVRYFFADQRMFESAAQWQVLTFDKTRLDRSPYVFIRRIISSSSLLRQCTDPDEIYDWLVDAVLRGATITGAPRVDVLGGKQRVSYVFGLNAGQSSAAAAAFIRRIAGCTERPFRGFQSNYSAAGSRVAVRLSAVRCALVCVFFCTRSCEYRKAAETRCGRHVRCTAEVRPAAERLDVCVCVAPLRISATSRIRSAHLRNPVAEMRM